MKKPRNLNGAGQGCPSRSEAYNNRPRLRGRNSYNMCTQ